MRGLVGALGTFTVCPVPRSSQAVPAPAALRWFPVVGVLLGVVATLPALAVWRGDGGGSALLGAVLVVAALALLTRGLHLDGLADLADGLGSGRPAEGALAVMRQPDIGPFGVAAVVLALLVQVASLATILGGTSRVEGVLAVALAAVTGRVAVVQAAGRSVPSARLSGFGALVAGSAGPVLRWGYAVVLTAAAAGAGLVHGSAAAVVESAAAVVAALVVAWLLRRHAVRRLGGMTGDVFGALVEVTTTVVLVVLAGGVAWR